MSDARAPRSIATAMEDVARWRKDAEQKNRSDLAECDQEMDSLRTAIANLQQQLEALRRFRDEIVKRDDKVAEEEIDKAYNAVFAALGEQAEAVRSRGERLTAAEAARVKAAEEALRSNPEIGALMKEIDQFKATEASLSMLPESYRAAIVQVHQANLKKVEDFRAKMPTGPAKVDAPSLPLDVVFAVDAPEGTPEVVMMVIPVQETATTEGDVGPADLQGMIVAAVVEGLRKGCAAAGVASVQPAFGGHQGLLAVEAEVPGARADLAAHLGKALDQAFSAAAALTAAQVEARARAVQVDHLLPPEESEADVPEATA